MLGLVVALTVAGRGGPVVLRRLAYGVTNALAMPRLLPRPARTGFRHPQGWSLVDIPLGDVDHSFVNVDQRWRLLIWKLGDPT